MVAHPDWTMTELADLLHSQEWQTADQVTHHLMLQAVHRQRDGHLTPLTLAQMPCDLLHHMDWLWITASRGQFGFSVQHRLYQALDPSFNPASLSPFNPHPFFQAVGWLMVTVPRPLAFFKFYDFLTFDLAAPPGHLPALWYWHIPWVESLKMGGVGTGRGGGFADLARLDALMLRLDRCSQVP